MNSNSVARVDRSHLVLLAVIIAFAATLRFFSLSALGFWTDELCSLSAADGWGLQLDKIPVNQIAPPLPTCTRLRDAKSFTAIAPAMAREDAHPPLYFMMLRGWEDFFGDSETAVRSLNVSFSLVAIALLFFVARESIGSSPALTACLLMAVATPQIQLSQEARNYMPVLVFSLCAAMAIQQLRRSPRWPWAVGLSLSLLAMMLTHYFAAGAAIGIIGYAVFSLRRRARNLVFASSFLAALLFALLWGPSILSQRTVFKSGLGWLADQAPGHLQRRLFDLLRLPVRFFAEVTDPRDQSLIALAGGIMLLYLPILFFRRRELRMWIAWLIGAVAIVVAADLSRSTTQLNWVRYTLFGTPAACVVLVSAIPRGRWRFALSAIAIVLALCCLPNAYVPAWKIDFRTPVQYVGHHLNPGDALVIVGPDHIADGIMFAAFQHYLPVMPTTFAVCIAAPSESITTRLRQCPRVWIIQLSPGEFAAWNGFTIDEQQSVPYFARIISGRFR